MIDKQINMLKVRKILLLLFILFLLGCEDKEKSAQQMFNESLNLWDKNFKSDSLINLERLIIRYPTTEISKKAYTQRSLFLITYKDEYYPHKIEKSMFSSVLQDKLNNYFKINNSYPNDIKSLKSDIELSSFLKYCSYEKAISNFGFRIDCDNADDIYREYESSFPSNKESTIKKDLPIDSFMAYYYTRENPNFPFFSEKVEKVDMHNINNKFPEINARNFKAYYIGYIETLKPQIKTIKINSEKGNIKILMNGKIIYIGNGSNKVEFNFINKLTKMEIYSENNWQTVIYQVEIVE